MPIQDGKYVTPAWQNGGAPAITAEELTAIGQSIEQDQTNITENTQNIDSNTESINTLDQWKTDRDPLIQGALQKSGGTMTGGLILNADPTQNMQAATKQYVDNMSGGELVLLNHETVSQRVTAGKSSNTTINFSIPSTPNNNPTEIWFFMSGSIENGSMTSSNPVAGSAELRQSSGSSYEVILGIDNKDENSTLTITTSEPMKGVYYKSKGNTATGYTLYYYGSNDGSPIQSNRNFYVHVSASSYLSYVQADVDVYIYSKVPNFIAGGIS